MNDDFAERFRNARAAFAKSKQTHDALDAEWNAALGRLNTMRRDHAPTNKCNDQQDTVADISRKRDAAKLMLDGDQRRLRVLDREALETLRHQTIADYVRVVAEVESRLADINCLNIRLERPDAYAFGRTFLPSFENTREVQPGCVLCGLNVIEDAPLRAASERIEARLTELENTHAEQSAATADTEQPELLA